MNPACTRQNTDHDGQEADHKYKDHFFSHLFTLRKIKKLVFLYINLFGSLMYCQLSCWVGHGHSEWRQAGFRLPIDF